MIHIKYSQLDCVAPSSLISSHVPCIPLLRQAHRQSLFGEVAIKFTETVILLYVAVALPQKSGKHVQKISQWTTLKWPETAGWLSIKGREWVYYAAPWSFRIGLVTYGPNKATVIVCTKIEKNGAWAAELSRGGSYDPVGSKIAPWDKKIWGRGGLVQNPPESRNPPALGRVRKAGNC